MKHTVLYLSPVNPFHSMSGYGYRTSRILQYLSSRMQVVVLYMCKPRLFSSTTHSLVDGIDTFSYSPSYFDFFCSGLLSVVTLQPFHFAGYSSYGFRRLLVHLYNKYLPEYIWHNKTYFLRTTASQCSQSRLIVDQHAFELTTWKNLAKNSPSILKKFIASINIWLVFTHEKRMVPKLYLSIAITDLDFRLTSKIFPSLRTTYIPQGVTPHKKPTVRLKDRSPLNLLFNGSDVDRNYDAMIFLTESILPYSKYSHRITVSWAGSVSSRRRKALIDRFPRILFLGVVPCMPSFLQTGQVFIAPFRMGEGMKTKIIEAISCGCLVLGTPLSFRGLHSLKKLSLIGYFSTPSQFDDSLTHLLDIASTDDRIDSACLRVSEAFDWDEVLSVLDGYIK